MTATQSTRSGQSSPELELLRSHPAYRAHVISGGKYELYPHLMLIWDAFIRALYDPTAPKAIVVTMPPRHGKSETISKWIPAIFLDMFPERKVLLASYEHDFASQWGRGVRDLIKNNPEHFRIRVSQDSASNARWNTAYWNGRRLITLDGGMQTAGLNSPATGKGGHLMIADDLVKNAEAANSPVERDNAWSFFQSTFLTRKEPGCITFILFTRWNQDDVIGRLREHVLRPDYNGPQFTFIDMPAMCEDPKNDPLGRKLGEPLCPQRYDKKALEEIKALSDDWVWNSLYQQRPVPPGGKVVDSSWWGTPENPINRYPAHLAHHSNQTRRFLDKQIIARYQSWDTALKDKQNSAYSVCLTVDLLSDYTPVLRDVLRERLTFDVLPDKITEQAELWNRDDMLSRGAIVIEDKASGISAIQTLSSSAPDWIKSIIVPWEQAGSDKIERMKRMTVWMKRGFLWLPTEDFNLVPWLFAYQQEIFNFPGSKFYDQADTTSQILQYLENLLEAGYLARNTPVAGNWIQTDYQLELDRYMSGE